MIVTIVIVISIFVICVVFSQMKINESNEYSMFLDAKRICRSVADNIDTIAEQGPGYFRYVSIPDKITGGYDYDIVTYTKFVEIVWDNPKYSPWNTQIITNNVSFCCNGICCTGECSKGKLSKGLNKKNKVYNDNGSVFVACNMPDLKFFRGTFLPTRAGSNENITLRIEIVNSGPVDANNFVVRFNHTETNRIENVTIPYLKADESIIVRANFTAPAYGNYTIIVDYFNNVSESIEFNNNYTVEIYRK